ncbi:hypothetical protein D9M71_559920 [compost metagenome]
MLSKTMISTPFCHEEPSIIADLEEFLQECSKLASTPSISLTLTNSQKIALFLHSLMMQRKRHLILRKTPRTKKAYFVQRKYSNPL